MADPPKSIKNSLLSGASSSSFFEDAALFVPVPLVGTETQEPATAEIDLNSDDSSPNRVSVEKELSEQLGSIGSLESADEGAPSLPEEPTTISLFSRATSTGGDLFSKMMSGSSSVASNPTSTSVSVPSRKLTETTTLFAPPKPPMNDSTMSTVGSAETPSLSSLYSAPPSRLHSVTPSTSHQDFMAPVSQPKAEDEEVIPSTISLFKASGPSAFAPTNVAARGSPSFMPASTLPSSNANTYYPPPNYPGAQFPVSGPALVSSPLPTTQPSLVSIPPPVASIPAPQIHGSSSSQGVPPSLTPSNSNAFRLGGQRMKYVPCPDMQSVPLPVSAAVSPPQSMVFSPLSNSTPSLTPAFTPAPVPAVTPPVTNMGASLSNPSVYSYGGTTMPDGTRAPRTMMQNAHQQLGPRVRSPLSPPNQPAVNDVVTTSNFHSPQTQFPQELMPLSFHWFYRKDVDGKTNWKPFSVIDSVALEDAFAHDQSRMVPTDGGRYDVCVQKRLKTPVYWDETPIDVRRGSWFFKGPMDNRFIPYDEEFAHRLETEYADCMRTGVWQKRLEFPECESVIMHSAGVVVHFCQAAAPDDWGNLPESQIRPRVVKRGVEEIEVEDGESPQVDHLVFVVHGIGPICDFKLRNIVEAVDDFRGLSFQLIHSHFNEATQRGLVGRVEFLPVSWHKALHGDKGIDEQLKRITLKSIPKFRDFTNDTLLDILFYTSPVYCQTIVNAVSSELNRIYKLFVSRHPNFRGNVSLTGHSLGSLILFDILAHQPVAGSIAGTSTDGSSADSEQKAVDLSAEELQKTEEAGSGVKASSSRTVSYTVGTAGTGQPFIVYPKIDFAPNAFFALGSPIAMFVTVRGIEKLGNDFRLPTCPAFFNIFHPYDPVAYRIETLIDPDFQNRPVLIPHHKGRKRIHLELKDTMTRVGADLKHRVIDAVKSTLNTVYHYTGFSKATETIDNEIQNAIAGEMEKKSEADGAEAENAHIKIGSLNGGRRIDHVLQEAPYETFNEYVFAMSTHVGYWESEDTMLLILTEIYGTLGIQRDQQPVGASSVTSPSHAAPSASNTTANYFAAPVLSQYDALTYQHHPAAPLPNNNHVQSPQNMYNLNTAMGSNNPPQVIPMMQQQPASVAGGVLLPPTPVHGAAASPGGRPNVIGNRPVTDPSYYPRGVDPTAPMLTHTQVAPPPKTGFVPKQ